MAWCSTDRKSDLTVFCYIAYNSIIGKYILKRGWVGWQMSSNKLLINNCVTVAYVKAKKNKNKQTNKKPYKTEFIFHLNNFCDPDNICAN